MNYRISLLLALCSASLPQTLVAEEVYFDTVSTEHALRPHGAYFGIGGGGAHLDSVDIRQRNSGKTVDGGGETGWMFDLKFGYAFNLPIPVRPAMELDFLYLDSETSGSGANSFYHSNNKAFLLMGSAVVSLDLSSQREQVGDFLANFHPYIGVGFGGGYVSEDNIVSRQDGKTKSRDNRNQFSLASDWVVGVEFNLSDELSLYGEYKRLYVDDFGGNDVSNAELSLWTIGVRFAY